MEEITINFIDGEGKYKQEYLKMFFNDVDMDKIINYKKQDFDEIYFYYKIRIFGVNDKNIYSIIGCRSQSIKNKNDDIVEIAKSFEDKQDKIEILKIGQKQNNENAIHELACIYEQEKNLERAIELYELSTFQNVNSMCNLAKIYLNSIEYKNVDKAFKWYELAANNNCSEGMYQLALMYRDGIGVKKNKNNSIQLLESAIKLNHSNAMNELGHMYEYGESVLINDEKAIKYYKMAIQLGNTKAMNNLAYKYFYGIGINTDKEKAIQMYKISAMKGSKIALYNLAIIYLEINENEGKRLMQMAAQKGLEHAIIKIENNFINKSKNYFFCALKLNDELLRNK